MKKISLLTWITQLGLSTAVPPVGFILLAVWLRERFSLGSWVLYVGIFFGLYCGVHGLYTSLKTLKRLADDNQKPPSVAFNDHT